jgi:hypothetical protein
MIAYWLWQFAPSLRRIMSDLSQSIQCIQIDLVLEPGSAWFNWTPDGTQGSPISCEVEGASRIRLQIVPHASEILASPDNAGERLIMAGVVRRIADLCVRNTGPAATLDDGEIGALLDRRAPLGPKKILLTSA